MDEPEEPRQKKSGVTYDDETYRDLRAGIKINRMKLDEEVIAQPNAFFHASEGATLASARRDKAKYDLEVAIAELDKDVRDSMIADGEKVTETQVKAQITREHDYHRAHQKLLDADLAVGKWQALQHAYR